MTATVTIRTPQDILDIIPPMLGFEPAESIVMVTFGGDRFTARVDLPYSDDDTQECIDSLLEPATRNRAQMVVFVTYSARRQAALLHTMVDLFSRAGIPTIEWLEVVGDTFFVRGDTVPNLIDSAGAKRCEMVTMGFSPLRSREELRESIEPAPGHLRQHEVDNEEALAVTQDALMWVHTHVATGQPLADYDLRLLLALLQDDLRFRDAAWAALTHENSKEQVAFWTDVMVRAPRDRACTAPAFLLAFAAWIAGHGAQAWVALDRCTDQAPDYTAADLLTMALDQAIPPRTWSPIDLDTVLLSA